MGERHIAGIAGSTPQSEPDGGCRHNVTLAREQELTHPGNRRMGGGNGAGVPG